MLGWRLVDSRVDVIHRLIDTHLPGYQVDTVTVLGSGVDNIAYEVNSELIVRFPREVDPARRAALVEREARLLAAVAVISPLPVPEPRFIDATEGCLAYRRLLGEPLLLFAQTASAAPIGTALGGLLTALHGAPIRSLAGLVDLDTTPLTDWRDEAAAHYMAVAAEIPIAHRGPIEAFLDAPPPQDTYVPVFSHHDLGAEHVLVDPATWAVTGVIDWADAAIGDPAYDFGMIWRDLGSAAVDAALRRYPHHAPGLQERAGWYARGTFFEDLAYGLHTGQNAYVTKNLAALSWLFPASAHRM